MNYTKLEESVARFYSQYPHGFNHPQMKAIAAKHKMDKMTAMADEFFNENAFGNPETVCEHYAKIATASSMVSVFEKVKFKDYVKVMVAADKELLSASLKAFLYGDKATGFEAMIDVLSEVKLAKWTLLTVIPAYTKPLDEVFVKPTTAKNVLKYYEVEGLHYSPKASYEFYSGYRELIMDIKSRVPEDLKPNNAAFSGFLMMTFPEELTGASKFKSREK